VLKNIATVLERNDIALCKSWNISHTRRIATSTTSIKQVVRQKAPPHLQARAPACFTVVVVFRIKVWATHNKQGNRTQETEMAAADSNWIICSSYWIWKKTSPASCSKFVEEQTQRTKKSKRQPNVPPWRFANSKDEDVNEIHCCINVPKDIESFNNVGRLVWCMQWKKYHEACNRKIKDRMQPVEPKIACTNAVKSRMQLFFCNSRV
jgi:hypothetical protein